MAQFQFLDGSAVPSPFVAVKGNSIPMKLVPAKGELVPLPISASPTTIATVTHVNVRTKPNFTTFHLDAVTVGDAVLSATNGGGKTVAGPVKIKVEARIDLPAAGTTAGLMTRLFLAETRDPFKPGFTMAAAKECMTLMRVVIENRLKTPSKEWGSEGAKTLTDVVTASGQFAGFSKYPTLSKDVQDIIDDDLEIANDGGDARRADMKAFIELAIQIANLPKVTDPTSTGLYFWMTSGSSPSKKVKIYKTLLNNTFFML
jgi:hypothetical protein